MAKQHVQGSNLQQNKCNLTPFCLPSSLLNVLMTKTVSLFCYMNWSKSISFSKVLAWLLYIWMFKVNVELHSISFELFPFNLNSSHSPQKNPALMGQCQETRNPPISYNYFSAYNHLLKQSADFTPQISGVYIAPWSTVNITIYNTSNKIHIQKYRSS